MSDLPELTWRGFLDFCHETDDIDVLETNEEQSFITIENLDETRSTLVAELFVAAHDSDVYVGSFDAHSYGGTVDFYPGGGD